MKEKLEVKKSKSVKERLTKKNYSGEASPYWDFLAQTRHKNESGELTEHVLANPDVLSEEESLYNRPLGDDDELRLRVVKEAITKLSSQQQRALQLCGFEGLTLREAAVEMGVSLATVQVLLRRAKKMIQRMYDREKLVS